MKPLKTNVNNPKSNIIGLGRHSGVDITTTERKRTTTTATTATADVASLQQSRSDSTQHKQPTIGRLDLSHVVSVLRLWRPTPHRREHPRAQRTQDEQG